jgi:tRNA U34 2-thiouridine synthase MnmA/TrmU
MVGYRQVEARVGFGVRFSGVVFEADTLKMKMSVTGHYAATDKTPEGRTRLLRSADELKDQTYYLSSCSESQLSRVSLAFAVVPTAHGPVL